MRRRPPHPLRGDAREVQPHTVGLTPSEAVGHYISLWKSSVEVQQHFNDIEWRIRGLALTVATFALGAAGVAAREGTTIGPISLGSAVLILGLLLWYAFYFVDLFWYHPLLKAAVAEGTKFEEAIREYLPEAGMTAGITARSRQPISRGLSFLAGKKGWKTEDGQRVMHSDHKLRWFYRVGTFAFVIGAIALQASVWLPSARPDASPAIPPVTSTPFSAAPSPSATP